jgi:cytochrome c biogenesis protein CcmG, thiol:disulfide interchange protein DsbE
MISRLLLVWALGFMVCSAPAATLKLKTLTVGTVTYTNVTVLGANVTDLYFTHANGIGNVKLKYLNAELQKRFNYDARTASEAERQQAEADALYQSSVVSNYAAQVEKASRPPQDETAPENLLDPVSDKSLLGKAGPQLEVEKWLTEAPGLQGKFVLVVFWAPWSAACRQCIPDLNGLAKKFPEHLAVVGLTRSTEEEIAQMTEPKLAFASALDPKGRMSTAAGVTSIPCIVLLDPKGMVLYHGHPAGLTEKKLQPFVSRPSE